MLQHLRSNKQGSSHAEMMQAIEGTFSVVDVDRTIPQPTGKEVRSVRSGEGEESERFFDVYDEAKAKGWALKYMDGYAVLKIERFRMGFGTLLLVWMALSTECKRKGITKLIVDISNNGGGIVRGCMESKLIFQSGYMVLILCK